MGRQKAQNIARDQYAALAAAELASDLIAAAEDDVSGVDQIVLEAVDEETWDDIVLYRTATTECQVNWQVKRQNTAFNKTTIDDVFTAMADRQRQATAFQSLIPDFRFGLATLPDVDISKTQTLRLALLRDLCETLRNPVVNLSQVCNSAQGPEKEWIQYLGRLFAEQDPLRVLEVLRKLEIVQLGTEADIRKRGRQTLRNRYDAPEQVFEGLFQFLATNSDPRFRFDYRALANYVLSKRARSHQSVLWTRISSGNNPTEWEVRGTEARDKIVAGLWGAYCGSVFKLQLRPTRHMDSAERVIVRLIAHRGAGARLELDFSQEWQDRLERLCGGTIGCRASISTHFKPNSPVAQSLSQVAATPEQPEVFAADVSRQMDAAFECNVQDLLQRALHDPAAEFALSVDPTLLRAMHLRWAEWNHALHNNKNLRDHVFRSLLATETEWQRSDFDRAVRVGDHNVAVCAYALFLGLAIAASFPATLEPSIGGGPSNLKLGKTHEIHLLALTHVSSTDVRAPKLVALAAADLVIGQRALTIVAGTQESAANLLSFGKQVATPFNADGASAESFQNLYTPTPLITADTALLNALSGGADAVRILVAAAVAGLFGAEAPMPSPPFGGTVNGE